MVGCIGYYLQDCWSNRLVSKHFQQEKNVFSELNRIKIDYPLLKPSL